MHSTRRRRVLLYTERQTTLQDIKHAIGRAAELIVASDLATAEAALRLYQSIEATIVEKCTDRNVPITILRLTEQTHPTARRIALVEHGAIGGIYDAVHDRTISQLIFLPFGHDDLRHAVGLDDPAGAEPSTRGVVRMYRRISDQPPLTGGIKAISSPSLTK